MNFGDWAGAVQNIVSVVAIVVGAFWAYYKFFRGRTFHRRAEVGLAASLLVDDVSHAICMKVTLENTGGSDIPLRVKLLTLRVFRRGELTEKGRPIWHDIATARVFDDHDWIESQETISDDVLIPLPGEAGEDVLAYRVTCQVYERRRPPAWKRLVSWRAVPSGGICWTSNTVVPVGLRQVRDESAVKEVVAMKQGVKGIVGKWLTGKHKVHQRPATEEEIRKAEQQASDARK